MSHVGDRIKQARIEKGMTQLDLATALGKTKATISRYELSSREPRYTQLCAIADALNIPVQQLAGPFEGDENKESAASEVVPADNQIEMRKLKKQDRMLLNIFDNLSAKGQKEAIQRLSELMQIPEYRKALTLSQALSLYVSHKNSATCYIVKDKNEHISIPDDSPFGGVDTKQVLRHIVVEAITGHVQHFWCCVEPITDSKTMERISNPCIDTFKDAHALVFRDLSSCRVAYDCIERRYADADPDEIPTIEVLYAQENKSGGWIFEEEGPQLSQKQTWTDT